VPAVFFAPQNVSKNESMKTYESVIIVKPQLSDGEVGEFVNKAKALITSKGGEVTSEEKLGRRKFTHEINHVRDGFYLYLKFKAEPSFIKEFENALKLNENVLRSMTMNAVEVKAKPAPVVVK
jgi:small subunit ribosomal protein S6